jgi:hypothetical protein
MVSALRSSQAEQVASNAWLQADGGSIFADAPNAGTSVPQNWRSGQNLTGENYAIEA